MKFFILILMSLLALASYASEEKARVLLTETDLAPNGLNRLTKGQGAPVLFVHGIDPDPGQPEWIKPLSRLMELDKSVYFHKWSKFASMKENQKSLLQSIRSILEDHGSDDLTVIGYSTGGVIMLMTGDELKGTPLGKRIFFHTVASPIFGYDAPVWALFGIPFVGSTTIAIGRGMVGKLKHKNLNQCFHWVNTNCELDKHACTYRNSYSPQWDPGAMPCGTGNTMTFHEESHFSILSKAVDSINF